MDQFAMRLGVERDALVGSNVRASFVPKFPSITLETASPRERSGCVRERACRAVRAEQRKAHRLAGALLDSLRARIVVEIRLGVARAGAVDLDPGRFQLDRHGERHGVESR